MVVGTSPYFAIHLDVHSKGWKMSAVGNHRDCHLFIKEENSFYYSRGTCSLTNC